MPADANISVIVCTHHMSRFARLRQAIDSVLRQSRPAHEVLLVVDGNEAVLEAARQEFHGVRVLPNARSKGLSGARNTGLLAATGEIVAFLDDDAVADFGWLSALFDSFRSPLVMGVGGPITPRWPDKRPAWLPGEFDWVVGCSYDGQATVGQVRNLIGCNMAFRRGALLMAGLFAEELGRVGADAAGVEETELCLRATTMFPAAALVMNDGAAVQHQIDEHRTTFRYFVRRCLAEGKSKALMTRRHPTRTGLSSERHHLLTVIPRRILAHIASGLARPSGGGPARAAASLAGTAMVAGSYLLRRIAVRRLEPVEPGFAPIKVVDLELDKGIEPIQARSETGDIWYGSAHLVVRDMGRLLATVQVPLYGEDLSAGDIAAIVTPYRRPPEPAAAASSARVRVVVATRDRPTALARCLDSLLAQNHANFEIVVVDNAPSSDETRRLVQQNYVPTGKVRYLLEERPGLSNAHNRGLDGLTADFVAFTDDDVVADRAWLGTLLHPFGESPQIGCVTGGILPAELETRAQYLTELHGGFLKSVQRQDFDLGDHRPDNPLFPYAAGMFGSGANMAFRSAALAAIGRFDPALGAGTLARGGDDLAAFADVVLAGYRLVYNPDALVWHYHRRGHDGMRGQAFGYGVGLGAYLTRLVLGRPQHLLTFIASAPAAARHILSPRSDKNARLPADYPRDFVWRERLGILAGVPAYLKSRKAARQPAGPNNISAGGSPAWRGT